MLSKDKKFEMGIELTKRSKQILFISIYVEKKT